jgi:GH3 auxin-responsive promoter
VKRIGRDAFAGDLSGLVARGLPPWIRGFYSPGAAVAALPTWDERLDATARLVLGQDLRLLAGMPSWILVLLERVRGLVAEAGRSDWPAERLWPNLAVLVHGGVRMDPYRRVLVELIGRPLPAVEVYPASEAFVALQVHPRDPGLTLLLDAGVFFEFVPVADVDRPDPPRLPVGGLRVGDAYSVLVSTPAGLWSYALGDTVRVVSLDPPQIVITGRTRHFVNAFGENVIVEEVEQAMAAACARTGAEVVEYTVAPGYPDHRGRRARHEWAVEFRSPPADLALFGHLLDETVQGLNIDYRTKRAGAVGMAPPHLSVLPPGSFHRWLRARGQLGDQHKVPRAANHREVLEGVLAASVGGGTPAPRRAAIRS